MWGSKCKDNGWSGILLVSRHLVCVKRIGMEVCVLQMQLKIEAPGIVWPKLVSYLSQHFHSFSDFEKTRADLNFLKSLAPPCLKTLHHLHTYSPFHFWYIIRTIFSIWICFASTNTFLHLFSIYSNTSFLGKSDPLNKTLYHDLNLLPYLLPWNFTFKIVSFSSSVKTVHFYYGWKSLNGKMFR